MTSYTNIFGGEAIGTAFPSYTSYTTAVSLTLTWPVAYVDSANNTANIIDLAATAGGVIIKMPPANQVSDGQAIIFNNVGGQTIAIRLNDNTTPLITLTAGQSAYVYLTDNTTTNVIASVTYYIGSWRTTPFGGGFVAVTSVAAVSSSNNLTITGSPITGAGTFTFNFALDLSQLSSFGTDTGYAVRRGTNLWSLRSITGTVNQITVVNPKGIAGNTVISLPSVISGITDLTVGNIQIVNNNINSLNANGNIIIDPNGTGIVKILTDLNLTTGSKLIFNNPADTATISFTAGNRTTNAAFTYPTVDPVNNQVLQVTSFVAGVGVLGWANVTTFGGPSTINAIARYADISGGLTNSGVSIDNANNITGVNSVTLSSIQIGVLSALTISTLAGNLKLAPNGASQVESLNSIAINNGLQLQLYTSGATPAAGFFTGLKAGALSASTVFTLPLTDGTTIGQSLTTNAATALSFSTIPGRNMIINGSMQVWQRGAGGSASFAVAGGTTAYTADRWQFTAGAATNFTISQQQGLLSGAFLCRVQRNPADTGTATSFFTTSLTRQMGNGAAGNALTISFKVRAGANFSATSNNLNINVIYGTGTNDVSVVTTGFTGQVTVLAATQAITTTLTNYSFTTSVLPATVTQLAVQIAYTPTGTAGANDYYDITDAQFEISPTQTPYDRISFAQLLGLCQFFYRKSFAYTTAPATNVGVNTAEFRFIANATAAAADSSPSFSYGGLMRTTPTLTSYNPAAANTQVRDETATADTTATTFVSSNMNGFSITCTGNAATVIGNVLGVHWSADADLT